MKNRGQNLVEFGIILALVAIGGVVVLTLLGANVKDLFRHSKAKYETHKPFEFASNNQGNSSNPSNPPDNNFSINPSPATGDIDVGGTNVTMHEDGSASFQYKGQDVMLNSDMLNDMNIVLETAGSSGTEKLVAMVQDMIDQYKSEYAPEDVPLEIMYGNGFRSHTGEESASGNAVANIVTIKVGDHIKIVQKDQQVANAPQGTFTIDYTLGQAGPGSIDADLVPGSKDFKDFDGLFNVDTYTDPATGNFYLIGTGTDKPPGGSGLDPSTGGVNLPPVWQNNETYINKDDGGVKDKVWLFEFDGNKSQSI